MKKMIGSSTRGLILMGATSVLIGIDLTAHIFKILEREINHGRGS